MITNNLQEQISSYIHGKESTAINICVVLKNPSKYKLSSFETNNSKLSQYCKNVLLNKVITRNSNINLLESKLARIYGICHVIINSFQSVVDDDPEIAIITQRTTISIEGIQSEDFYNLQIVKTPISFGGFSHEVQQLSLLINYSKSQINSLLRPVGVLLHGPPGCGKTSLAKHLAYTTNAVFIKLEASDILQSEFGIGAASLKSYFNRAVSLSSEGSVILFIDEIDTLCPENDHSSLGNKQLTSALISEMDNLHTNNVKGLIVLAATNYISNINALLRRPGRFDREVLVNVPTQQQRLQILEVLTANTILAPDVSLPEVASWTVGFVGADLEALCEEAAHHAQNILSHDNETPGVTMSDFMYALHTVRPSLKKGQDCVVELQPIKWEDIGGLEEVKAEIKQSIEWPLLYPDALCRMDLSATKGLLLYGPPGCCKTTLVRAAASSCKVTFLALSGAQVYSPYVGESEKIISEAFQRARSLSPTILFFDEIESLVGSRSASGNQSRVQERILSTMLNEMDGVGIRLDRKMDAAQTKQKDGDHKIDSASEVYKSHVIVIGATNRPDMLDPAIMRPGRLDKLIYVPPPDLQSREAILSVLISKMATMDIDLHELGNRTESFSGADLKNLCLEAGLITLRENYGNEKLNSNDLFITNKHFLQALETVKPSLTGDCLNI